MLLFRGDIDFSCARPVITAAQKYIVPVAVLPDADPLVYPPGHERAGQPITDWQGNPVGDRGLIFFNRTDKCHQAVPADGRSVIVINEVAARQARAIEDFIHRLGHPIHELSKSSLERLITHLQDALGLHDIYNSTDNFIRSRMVWLGGSLQLHDGRPWGWMRRDERDVCRAVFIRGPGQFAGPAATAQQIPCHGAFIVEEGSSCHMVDAAVMLRTYMNPDSSPLNLGDFIAHL